MHNLITQDLIAEERRGRMRSRKPIFDRLDEADAALAREVADRVGLRLDPSWVSGVAANARLVQRHLDLLRDGDADGR